MGTQRGQMKGVLSWLARWACRAGKKYICSVFAALVCPSTKYFFPQLTLFPFLCPVAQLVGRQPRRVACLLVCVSGHTYNNIAYCLSFRQICNTRTKPDSDLSPPLCAYVSLMNFDASQSISWLLYTMWTWSFTITGKKKKDTDFNIIHTSPF